MLGLFVLFSFDGVCALQLLKEKGYTFDIAFTSVLKRAIRTLW